MHAQLTIRERRQIAGGISALMFTAGATWIAASQSFVTKVGGHFTHPSPWNWWLIVCIVGVGIGIFIFVATIRQGFLPKKFRFQDLSSQYTLGLLQPGVDPSETEHSYFYEISPFLKFLNGGSAVLEVYLEHLTAEANGQPMSSGNFGVRKLRILPGQTKTFRSAPIRPIPYNVKLEGSIDYSILYGPPSGHPQFRRKHSVGIFSVNKVQKGDTLLVDFRDLVEETDDIVSL